MYEPQEQGVNVIHSEDKDVQRIAAVVLGPSRGMCELSIPMSKPLFVEIRELVVNRLQTKLATGEQIDVAEMTSSSWSKRKKGRVRVSPSLSQAWGRNISNGEVL
jgi:hypothetical protein